MMRTRGTPLLLSIILGLSFGASCSPRGWSAEKNWWYFAVPIKAGPELADDLKEEY